LQTDSSGNIVCATISTGGASTGGGWTTDNVGDITLATTSDRVGLGATSTPYAKLSILSGSAGTTTLALLPASGQTANIIDITTPREFFLQYLHLPEDSVLEQLRRLDNFSAAGSGVFGGDVLASTFTATSTSATSSLPNLSATNFALGSNYITNLTGSGLSIIAEHFQ